MNIPEGREIAALWVFQFSVITVITGFVIIPFNAAIVAHERMNIYAYLGIAEAMMRLIIALVLAFGNIQSDRLILYALLWLIATLLLQVTAISYCVRCFSECRFRRVFDKPLLKDMFSFAGWKFIGSIAKTFSGQGVNVAINIAFGTAVNAARGLAGTVNNAVGIFFNNIILALNPQVTKSYASGDSQYLKSLLFLGTKFCFFIFYLVAFPLFLETDFVLSVWLVEVPEYTTAFVRLILLITLVDLFSAIFNMAIFATGTIRFFQLWTSIVIFLIFPVSQIALRMGCTPEFTYIINLLAITINNVVSLWFVKHLLGYSIREIIFRLYTKIVLTVLISLIIPIPLYLILPSGWGRLIVIVFSSLFYSSIVFLFIGCSKQERTTLLYNYILPWIKRFKKA